ncbi:MAG: molecular chaperone HtpG [Deltaproteobacteria bacterium RIFOXYD12_FULL_50_9]|nr:MAG: molecular chaperone HtpG [Deltaproteobacteria bacterium RIFOXYD12_FULL_50_9]
MTTETREFQAEVNKLLDIVIHSLYTEREIFLRELLSNSADALEKFRHQSLLEKEVFDDHVPLEIAIQVNETENVLTITDSGIGMTKEELISNLGTIAHSGSKTFLTALSESAKKDVNLIGQFGVGFYSAFMVAKRVVVHSRSYRLDDVGHEWTSDASGSFTISEAPGIHRGTKIKLELKEDAKEYSNEATIKRIIKQYSSFVPFPIKISEETINTVQAIWTRNRNEIKEEEYNEFYKYVSNAVDEPLSRLHFSTDAPLAIQAVLFIPKENFERLGFGRTEPGVSLYCRRVLIEQHSKNILPEWLRFARGVVDSEDLPLNISRQALQDNALLAKVNRIITKRFLKHLEEIAKETPEQYEKIWQTFGMFLKEGATSDYTHQDEIAKLLRYESSKTEPGKLTSLADYVARMQEGQKEIYYINGPNRASIEAGPYLEAFKKREIEIIYTLDPIDDFVLSRLSLFDEKKLTSADRADLELPELADDQKDAEKTAEADGLDKTTTETLTKWLKDVLGARINEVRDSKRLVDSPAIIVNPDGFMTSSMERIMRASSHDLPEIRGKNLEINTHHPLIKNLAVLKETDELFAKIIAEQIVDNAMIQAGLLVETRNMVERSYKILERVVQKG